MTAFSDIVDDEIYTPKQVAEALKVPRRRIVDAFRSGELAGIELGPRTIRITGEAVRQWQDLPEDETRQFVADAIANAKLAKDTSGLKYRPGNWVDQVPESFMQNSMGGVVYLIDCLDMTKIGFTTTPLKERVAAWITGNPFDLMLFAVMAGDIAKEKELHQSFQHCRRKREWFRLSHADRQHIIDLVTEHGGVIVKRPEHADG